MLPSIFRLKKENTVSKVFSNVRTKGAMLDPSYISCEAIRLPLPARSLPFALTVAALQCSHPTKQKSIRIFHLI